LHCQAAQENRDDTIRECRYSFHTSSSNLGAKILPPGKSKSIAMFRTDDQG
jgi:hypothetical protein